MKRSLFLIILIFLIKSSYCVDAKLTNSSNLSKSKLIENNISLLQQVRKADLEYLKLSKNLIETLNRESEILKNYFSARNSFINLIVSLLKKEDINELIKIINSQFNLDKNTKYLLMQNIKKIVNQQPLNIYKKIQNNLESIFSEAVPLEKQKNDLSRGIAVDNISNLIKEKNLDTDELTNNIIGFLIQYLIEKKDNINFLEDQIKLLDSYYILLKNVNHLNTIRRKAVKDLEAKFNAEENLFKQESIFKKNINREFKKSRKNIAERESSKVIVQAGLSNPFDNSSQRIWMSDFELRNIYHD